MRPPLLRTILGLSLLATTSCLAAGLPGRDGEPVVVRGIGWSPWHKTEHWSHSQATRDLDRKLLRGAHINTLRSWGRVRPQAATARLEDGLYSIPTIHCREGLAAEFSDGTKKGIAFSDPETREDFAKRVEEEAKQYRDHEGVLCILLGNEYSGVGRNPRTESYQYKGFEASTQARFRAWIEQRFGSIAQVNKHCGTEFDSFEDVKPLANRRFRYEYWLFLNRTFEQFMQAAHEACKRGAPDRPTSYAKLMGTHWDPYTEDARLSFLDVGGDNLYWGWVKDWARYNAFIDDLIAAAKGNPVLITEGGFQSLILGEDRAARLTKQMLWNAFMHREVAGFCVFVYCDEWYKDGNPKEQAKGESWGIVTADRRPKQSYYAVAEVYGIIEKLNDFFATCQAPPVVAVSNQALGQLVLNKSTKLHNEIARVLYSNGVPFKSVMPADVYDLKIEDTPRLIFCDELLDCEPDGSRSALEAFVQYVAAGGQVLYLCPRPWQLPYGHAQVPEALRFDTDSKGIARARHGAGAIRFLPRNEFGPGELTALVLDFLSETGAPQALKVAAVTPQERQQDAFCRLLTSGDQRILLLVNAADEALQAVEIDIPGAKSATLLFADGATLSASLGEDDSLRLALRGIDTYALVEVRM